MLAAIAGAVNARFAVQCENFKAGVVSENGRFDVALGEPLRGRVGFDDSVFCEGLSVFDNVFVKSDIFQCLEFVMVGTENVGEVSDFSGTAGRDNKKVFHKLVVSKQWLVNRNEFSGL